MKIPVSMLPASGKATGSVLLVMGAIFAVAFFMKANQPTQHPRQ